MTLKALFVKSQKRVSPLEIVYIQAQANYSIVKMQDGNKYLLATTLKKLEEKLANNSFIRPHKSFLKNTRFIERYEAGVLKLKGGLNCVCSRRKRQQMDLLFCSKPFSEKRLLNLATF